MYVLNVIPFSRSAPAGVLSYRSRTEVAPGTLVRVTLRRSQIHALVVECMSVAEAKATIKAASFTLSGSRPAEEGSLPPALIDAARVVAEHHAAPLGTTFAALLAPFVREEFPLPPLHRIQTGSAYTEKGIEASIDERAVRYRELIVPTLTEGTSVLMLVPTLAELSHWERVYKEFSPLVVSGALSPKKRLRCAEKIAKPGTLILATPSFAWLPLPALGLLIVERVSAGGYRMAQRPYLDMRIATRALARHRGVPLVLGDYPLPLEYRAEPERPVTRPPAVPVTLLDTRRPKDDQSGEAWTTIPRVLEQELRATLEENGRALVLAVRKGYAPSVVCRDCGHTLTDERGAVLTFTTRNGVRLLRTADGVSERPAETLCPSCGSWNLLPLGIGIERVVEDLRTRFPHARIVEASREVRTQAAATKLLEEAAEPGTIVVGTESVLPWLLALGMRFELGVLASADSLLAVPFWRARERLVRLGFLLMQCTARVIIASRLPDDAAVRTLATPGSSDFFQEETILRRALGYPPFGTLIAVQVEAPRPKLEAIDGTIRAALGSISYTVLPDRALAGASLRRSYVIRHAAWPDSSLVERLQRLPPSVRVLIDPEAF